MLSYGDVKVLDADGKIKKVIKAKALSKAKWKTIEQTQDYNVSPPDYLPAMYSTNKEDYIPRGDKY